MGGGRSTHLQPAIKRTKLLAYTSREERQSQKERLTITVSNSSAETKRSGSTNATDAFRAKQSSSYRRCWGKAAPSKGEGFRGKKRVVKGRPKFRSTEELRANVGSSDTPERAFTQYELQRKSGVIWFF